MNFEQYRADFPLIEKEAQMGKIYLDNAATTQKPKVVIDAVSRYYKMLNANIHRGVHRLSQEATNAYEETRKKLQTHFKANFPEEIIFTAGTTHGINMVASGFDAFVKKGDNIIVSAMEHHSNIVPWQMLCERTGAKLQVIPMNAKGVLQIDAYEKLLSDRTRMVAVAHASNALGTINPIKKIVRLARGYKNCAVLVDGAQACPHLRPDMQHLDADFYVASAHKIFAPTGVGVLYGKLAWLEKIPPYQGGGEMIKTVSFEKTTYACLPHRLEAGTPNIAGVIAFATAIDYLENIGFDRIQSYEKKLLTYATDALKSINGLQIYGEATEKVALVSFGFKGLHPYDIGSILNQLGIAVRTGHHCAQPIMDFFNIPGTIRASFAFYNTLAEIDALVKGIKKAVQMLS